MDLTNVSKSVRRITVLQTGIDGTFTPVAVYERAPGRKKGTRLLRPAERATRQFVEAHSRGAAAYLGRHARSNGKRKDGWLRDWSVNVMKATRKGTKAIKISRLFS